MSKAGGENDACSLDAIKMAVSQIALRIFLKPCWRIAAYDDIIGIAIKAKLLVTSW